MSNATLSDLHPELNKSVGIMQVISMEADTIAVLSKFPRVLWVMAVEGTETFLVTTQNDGFSPESACYNRASRNLIAASAQGFIFRLSCLIMPSF